MIAIMILTAGTIIYMQTLEREKEPCQVCKVEYNETTTIAKNATEETQVAKKTLVFLYSDDCPFCEEMKPIIDSLSKSFNVTQINIDSTPAAAQYDVKSTPTMVVLQGDKEIARFVGLTSEQALLDALR